jgi:hypothetical protein
MAIAGGKIVYKYTILRMLSIQAYLGMYWGSHSNYDSLFTKSDSYIDENGNEVLIEDEYGWLLNIGLKANIKF